MKTKLYILGAFALGVGCGSVGAYIYAQKKFDSELEEQTEELKAWAKREVERQLERAKDETFLSEDKISSDSEKEDWGEWPEDERLIQKERTRVNYNRLSSPYRGEKPDLETLAEKLRAEHEAPTEDDDEVDPKYIECYRTINEDDIDPIPLHSCEGDWFIADDESHILKSQCENCPFFEGPSEADEPFVTPPIKTGILYDRGEAPEIEIISEEEFFDPTKTYESEQLTYYKQDDTLCDADDEVVDIEKTVGGDALTQFEDGTVYVRNHRKETDYEIEEEDKSYRHYVLGMDDDDEDPRSLRRRFADREEE